jgi:hypothetical protein
MTENYGNDRIPRDDTLIWKQKYDQISQAILQDEKGRKPYYWPKTYRPKMSEVEYSSVGDREIDAIEAAVTKAIKNANPDPVLHGSFAAETPTKIDAPSHQHYRRRTLRLISEERYTEIVAGMMAEMAGLLVGEPDIEKASEILRTLDEVHARRYGEETVRPDPDTRYTPGDSDPNPMTMDPM